MNIWENAVLTDKGEALQTKLLNGQTLKIKRVTTGAKKVPVVDLRQQTEVTEGGYDITLQPSRTDGEKMILPVLLENKGLKESYDLWQVGVYAEDPDEGEVLFCLAQAAQAKNIPSEEESPGFSVTWDFCFDISNTAPFEVVMNSAGLVNIEAYQAHTEAIERTNSRINSINMVLDQAISYSDANILFVFGTIMNGSGFYFTNSIYIPDTKHFSIISCKKLNETTEFKHVVVISQSSNYVSLYSADSSLAGSIISAICSFK